MQTETRQPLEAVADKLSDPKVAASLTRLLERSDELAQAASTLTTVSKAFPELVATITDIFDERCRMASESGLNLEDRFHHVVRLFVKVTEPETIAVLEQLIDRLPQLQEVLRLVDDVPKLLATVVDVVDEYAKKLSQQGIDVEKSFAQSLHAVLWLGSRISETELDRLGILLRSDVLDTHALEVIGNAATSLANCQQQTCANDAPDRIGMLGLVRALQDPNVQKTLGFATRFAKCFGTSVGTSNGQSPATH